MTTIEILTGVTAIGALIAAIASWRSASATARLVREQARPYIHVFLKPENLMICLVIKNSGQTTATDVIININPSLDTIASDETKGTFEYLQSHSSLAPKQEVIQFVNDTISFHKIEKRNIKLHVEIDYKDVMGKKYSEKIMINLNGILNPKKISQYSDNHYFGKIAQHLKTINETLKSIRRLMKKNND